MKRVIKAGVLGEIGVIIVMQCIGLFAVEMGGNESWVLDQGFPGFKDRGTDDNGFDRQESENMGKNLIT